MSGGRESAGPATGPRQRRVPLASPLTTRSVPSCQGPYQTPWAARRRALSFLDALAPTSSAREGGEVFEGLSSASSAIVKRHATDQIAFHFRKRRSYAAFLLIKVKKLALHRRAQLTEVRSPEWRFSRR